MKNVVYFDPETFVPSEMEFSDFHYDLQEKLRKATTLIFGDDAVISAALSDKEGKVLSFGIMRNRHNGEEIAEKYKVTIEKISDAK